MSGRIQKRQHPDFEARYQDARHNTEARDKSLHWKSLVASESADNVPGDAVVCGPDVDSLIRTANASFTQRQDEFDYSCGRPVTERPLKF